MVQVFSAAGSQIARYPRTVFGTLGLCVVFSFVAGNALWYQPRSHPSPFLATRDPGDMEAIAGYRPNRFPAQGDVTTFHIARAPEQPDQAAAATETPARPIATPVAAVQQVVGQTGATPVAGDSTPAVIPHVVPQPRPLLKAQAEDPVAAAIRAASDLQAPVAPPPRPPADIASVSRAKQVVQDPLKPVPVSASAEVQRVLEIQRGLQNIAYRDVTVDGVVGDTTKAAIRHFQKHYRLPVTGEPSQAVLDKLKSIGAL